jgi:phosphomannomutase
MRLFLFDVDGTLAESTKKIKPDLVKILEKLDQNPDIELGIVGGGSYQKITEQLGQENLGLFRYVFAENGIIAYQDGQEISSDSIKNNLSERTIQDIINFVLRYIADLELPFKRGRFVVFRNGMLYITPIGGDCSDEERKIFAEYDRVHKVRIQFIQALYEHFGSESLDFLMGGQIGIGIHPKGWDKTYCLRHIPEGRYQEIHFYGDRTEPEGNDYPLYSHPSVIGHGVKNPEDTLDTLIKMIYILYKT